MKNSLGLPGSLGHSLAVNRFLMSSSSTALLSDLNIFPSSPCERMQLTKISLL